ncbi:hypothetical protein F2Q70_00010293 [Brassica cretica]|uniref:Senescence domain-containing protein n=1 Tax=Brassica cretica TaxID=69181 RepID=A0A8S9M8I2_BRACR|nr:hypothetical protein F2Q68_00003329 [Brassica cretica]KAF2614241.1 hypothetical protein F2Q70_00010293 [Brassica cretica]
MTKMTKEVVNGVLSGVIVAGRNVMKTSSTIMTTKFFDHMYGANTVDVTNAGIRAGEHALGTA